jgi:hypothetical protein
MSEVAAGLLVATALLVAGAWVPPLIGLATKTAGELPALVADRLRFAAQELRPLASSLCKAPLARACSLQSTGPGALFGTRVPAPALTGA